MHVEHAGDHGPAILLIHGSLLPGWQTWSEQRVLADTYRLTVPHRSGYPPNAPLEHIDFEAQAHEVAELIQPGMHVVGHSYGAVVSSLAAALVRDGIRSLTLIEPPAFGVARGNLAVEQMLSVMVPIFDNPGSPRDFMLRFTAAAGATPPLPDPLPPEVAACARATMVERPPWEATIPFDTLSGAAFPKLMFSGGHSPAFDAVVDVFTERLGAEKATVVGRRHSVPRTGEPFNSRLRAFVDAAEASALG